MVKSILFALALSLGNLLLAQWVSIPDTACRNCLQVNCPGCAPGSCLDTSSHGMVQLAYADEAPSKAFTMEASNGFGQWVDLQTFQAGQQVKFDLSA